LKPLKNEQPHNFFAAPWRKVAILRWLHKKSTLENASVAKKRKIGHHGKMAVAGSWSLADRIRKNTVNGIVVCTSQSKM